MPKISFVVASEASVKAFLTPHIDFLCKYYDIFVNVNTNSRYLNKKFPDNVKLIHTPIQRKISIIKDLFSIFVLFKQFKKERPLLVFSLTPKAGLLAAISGFASGVPCRVHCFTGQVWATRRGIPRFLLKAADICVARLSTHILADSCSQKKFLIEQNVVKSNKILVLGDGSIAGVDTHKFSPNATMRCKLRQQLEISDEDLIFLFVGRLNRDKGIPELAQAFANLSNRVANVTLVIVGPDEEEMVPLIRSIANLNLQKIRLLGYTDQPQNFMAASDVFCLPSHREGFGTTIIESAACGLPTIATNIYGITDAIVDGETGVLIPVKNIDALEAAMDRMVTDPVWRMQLADQARQRAISKFSVDLVVNEMYRFLSTLTNDKEFRFERDIS